MPKGVLSLCSPREIFSALFQFVLNYFFSPISSGGTLASNHPRRSHLFPLPPSVFLNVLLSGLDPLRHRPRRRQAPHRRNRLRPARRQRKIPRISLHANR